MKTELNLMERERETVVGHVRKLIRKKKLNNSNNNNKKKQTKMMKRPTMLQRLFMYCQKLFKGLGTVPSPDDVQNLCRILDVMTPEDVGLSRDLQFFNSAFLSDRGIPRVTHTCIYECKKFSLTLLIFPAGAVIPLHNHPEMTVFSKLLLGTMHIKSYDWVDTNNLVGMKPLSQLRLARLKADRSFTAPCDTSVLYPTSGGNIHAFTALTPCLVLDVLGPPYSKDDGRDCSFYVDFPCKDIISSNSFLLNGTKTMKEEEGDCRYGWLQEIEPPEDAEMDGIEYLGPPVVDVSAMLGSCNSNM
ncbi:plant cysteine oxidase 2-like [Impatiens glandulifera]|uniref:plant cysteine oxidase 2-like n=1 Tax=Impatiens glandulifera TaxID=253017 RepID=UPI001FB15680|nr:plant cysteine oxidase 2-like [Impatiens glandulifera]XP_047318846.1 plant cysteine oxidase 2-like [Impatiens glandulifera]